MKLPVVIEYAYVRLTELRSRMSWCAVLFVAGGIVGYIFQLPIISALRHTLGPTLFYSSPTSSFEFAMRACTLVGFLFAIPAVMYHLLRMLEPEMPRIVPRQFITRVITASVGLMALGITLAYFAALPAALLLLNHVGAGDLKALITAEQYFAFAANSLGIFAATFQLPLLLALINRRAALKPSTLPKYRNYIIVSSFLLAFLLPSTPDPLSQALLAFPPIVVFELSIWTIWLLDRRRHRAEVKSASTSPTLASPPPLVMADPVPAKRQSVQRPPHAQVSRQPVAPRPPNVAEKSERNPPKPRPQPQRVRAGSTARDGVLDLSHAPVVDAAPLPKPSDHIIDLSTPPTK